MTLKAPQAQQKGVWNALKFRSYFAYLSTKHEPQCKFVILARQTAMPFLNFKIRTLSPHPWCNLNDARALMNCHVGPLTACVRDRFDAITCLRHVSRRWWMVAVTRSLLITHSRDYGTDFIHQRPRWRHYVDGHVLLLCLCLQASPCCFRLPSSCSWLQRSCLPHLTLFLSSVGYIHPCLPQRLMQQMYIIDSALYHSI